MSVKKFRPIGAHGVGSPLDSVKKSREVSEINFWILCGVVKSVQHWSNSASTEATGKIQIDFNGNRGRPMLGTVDNPTLNL